MSASKPDLSQFKSDRVRFEDVGDSIAGQLRGIEIKAGQSGDVLVLTVEDDSSGEERQVWCPTMLARAVADRDPGIGAHIKATLTGLRPTGRPSPLKEFVFEASDPDVSDGDPF
jgi:hypothetical protein